jgi:hypothetical protein
MSENELSFSDLIQNGKFLGDLAENLLNLDPQIKKNVIEYQAICLLASEKGIPCKEGRKLFPRANLITALENVRVNLDADSLDAAVKRIGAETMPKEVPPFGDILQSTAAIPNPTPETKPYLEQDILNDLLILQSAGRIIGGIAPQFDARFDEENDPPDLIKLQKVINSFKAGNPVDSATAEFAARCFVQTESKLSRNNGTGHKLSSKALEKLAEFKRAHPKMFNIRARFKHVAQDIYKRRYEIIVGAAAGLGIRYAFGVAATVAFGATLPAVAIAAGAGFVAGSVVGGSFGVYHAHQNMSKKVRADVNAKGVLWALGYAGKYKEEAKKKDSTCGWALDAYGREGFKGGAFGLATSVFFFELPDIISYASSAWNGLTHASTTAAATSTAGTPVPTPTPADTSTINLNGTEMASGNASVSLGNATSSLSNTTASLGSTASAAAPSAGAASATAAANTTAAAFPTHNLVIHAVSEPAHVVDGWAPGNAPANANGLWGVGGTHNDVALYNSGTVAVDHAIPQAQPIVDGWTPGNAPVHANGLWGVGGTHHEVALYASGTETAVVNPDVASPAKGISPILAPDQIVDGWAPGNAPVNANGLWGVGNTHRLVAFFRSGMATFGVNVPHGSDVAASSTTTASIPTPPSMDVANPFAASPANVTVANPYGADGVIQAAAPSVSTSAAMAPNATGMENLTASGLQINQTVLGSILGSNPTNATQVICTDAFGNITEVIRSGIAGNASLSSLYQMCSPS